MIAATNWPEKYRPKTLEECALSEENRAVLASYIARGEVPHCLFFGPPGTGKKTVAKILVRHLDCQLLELNASNERGIDTIREKVTTFARGLFGNRWNIVFLDEADHLTNDAQASLRNIMETYESVCRFILSANYVHKVIAPLQSRCEAGRLKFDEVPAVERAKRLIFIGQQEGVAVAPAVAFAYASKYSDIRKMLNAAQREYSGTGSITNPNSAKSEVSGEVLYSAILARDWQALIASSKTTGFDHLEALRAIFWAIPVDAPKAANHKYIMARAVHESGWTPDPVVHFLGACAEVMSN